MSLEDKNQKLQNECSKLKSQMQVLKNSYQEEQSKNANLGESLREKEQLLKKLNGEMDRLFFQNKQLTKKVFVLQEDLAELSSSTKNAKSKDASNSVFHVPKLTDEDLSVLNSELQQKIQENERLHLEQEASKKESELAIQTLSSQLDSLKQEYSQKFRELKDLLETEQQRANRLSTEKSRLEAKLIGYIAEIQQSKAQATSPCTIATTVAAVSTAEGESTAGLVDGAEASDACGAPELPQKLKEILDLYQEAASTAASYQMESCMLENRLEILEDELRISHLQNDELKITVKNYEAQLNVMTEHIAQLNDKIMKQSNEIADLGSQLPSKGKSSFRSGK